MPKPGRISYKMLDQFIECLPGTVRKNQISVFNEGMDLLPESLQEALKTILEVARIILDESHPDETIGDAIFSKVPREKIEKALSIIKEWEAELDLIDFD